MQIKVIAAVALNRVIGKDNQLNWDLPADRAYFRKQVEGHFVIMGRRTYDSHLEEEVVPYHQAVVVTRQQDWKRPNVIVSHSLKEAYEWVAAQGANTVFVLGGGEIYALSMEDADELLITEVKAEIDGDVRFPEISEQKWKMVHSEDHSPDVDHQYAYSFMRYQRR